MRFLTAAVFCLTALASVGSAQTIIAHRGASFDAPENTLAAFHLAWEQGADGIEGDFYLTSDEQIVCIHDKTTKRVAPDAPELKVADATLQQLRRLDVGRWKAPRYAGETTPTLEEVLETVPAGKQFFVEIKCGPEILPVLQPQLEASGLRPEQIVIIAFDKDVVRGARKMMPQYRASWLTSYKQQDDEGPWKPSREQVVRTLQDTGATGLGTNGNLAVVDTDFARAVRDADREFHVWTINEPAQARTFRDLGVDSITTDRPAFLRSQLAQPVGGSDQP